mmetsp:Transcript_63537/g.148173  ORF Transcript_63537/g.148173 Transcript_63537/m.148173 type:complete len:209 (-) Transcript_63537:71-697(-)
MAFGTAANPLIGRAVAQRRRWWPSALAWVVTPLLGSIAGWPVLLIWGTGFAGAPWPLQLVNGRVADVGFGTGLRRVSVAAAPPDWFNQGFKRGFQEGTPGMGGGMWGNLEDQGRKQVPFAGDNPWRKVPTATRDWYTALTKIRIRVEPNVGSAPLGTAIAAGETFEVNAELAVSGQKYLKLAKQKGWVFTHGVAGDWTGKEIVRRKQR